MRVVRENRKDELLPVIAVKLNSNPRYVVVIRKTTYSYKLGKDVIKYATTFCANIEDTTRRAAWDATFMPLSRAMSRYRKMLKVLNTNKVILKPCEHCQ